MRQNKKEIVIRMERTIEEQGLLAQGERFLIAVSGGPDSVALLHMIDALRDKHRWLCSAVHVNHGLRGSESDEEEAYVQRLCRRLHIPCAVRRVDVKARLQRYGNNIQAAARALRFDAFREAAAAFHTDTVVLGHHGDDQAETVLMRLLRGTGPGGLAGIRSVTKLEGLKLIRPLLRITKNELEGYCIRHGLEPRFDSSNASRSYFRNVVRLDILPFLMKQRSGAADSLRRIAELSADESDFMDAMAERRVREGSKRIHQSIRAPRTLFEGVHVALQRRMIKIILNSLKMDESSVDYEKIERMREAILAHSPTTLELQLSGKVFFRRSYESLEWTAVSPARLPSYNYGLDAGADGTIELDTINGLLEWTVRRKEDATEWLNTADSNVACFDADTVPEGFWHVRTRRPGDRIEPFGLNGSKKVKDMFIDGKLPALKRDVWPVVTDPKGVLLWVPGFRRSKHALIGEGTVRVIAMRLRVSENIIQ
jgi:tRNA(Ile)-lysidine synthase